MKKEEIKMDSNKIKISSRQLGILLIVTIVGVGILTLPREVLEIAGTDGWILIILGGIASILMSLVIHTLSMRFPNQTIIEYSEELLGRPLSILIGIIIFTYCSMFAAFSVRIFGEVLKMFLLPKTPIEVITITFLLTAGYLVRNGLEPIVRFYELIIMIMFIPYLLALFAGTSNVNFTNLLPVFQTSPRVLLKGSFQIIFSYIGFEFIFLLFPFVSDQKNIRKTLLISISSIILLYLITNIFVLATFGEDTIESLIWPLMAYIKSIEIPGGFIEQLEGIIMTIWVLFIYTTLSTVYFLSSFTLSRVMNVKEHSFFVSLLLPVIYILSLLPDNVAQLYDWLGIFSFYGSTLVSIIIPSFLLLVAKVRKKGEKANG